MSELFRTLGSEIYLQPLLAGIALAVPTSLLSVLVVHKRLAFIGQGITHAGFGGIGLAAFLAVSGLARDGIVLAVCLASGLIIGALSRDRRVRTDTAIGIMLVTAMGAGFLLDQVRLHLRGAWYEALRGGRRLQPTPWEEVLFGSIQFIDGPDMWAAIVVSLLVLAVLFAFGKEILFYAFDETTCVTFGVPSTFMHYLVLGLLAVVIVTAMKLTGVLLVTAYLVVPGAAASLVSRRLGVVLVTSVIVGEIAMVGGFVASVAVLGGELTTGPFIVLLLALQFGLAWSLNRLARRLRGREARSRPRVAAADEAA